MRKRKRFDDEDEDDDEHEKRTMLKRLAIFLVRCYQWCLSPLIPPCCRFEPTCSNYAIEALRKKGVIRGSLLAAWRILRCNPWSKGGYDPVQKPPEKPKGDEWMGG